MDEVYDVVVLGTGVVECILSGLLSVDGKKVLHTDRNPYYGGESASMNLSELYQKFKGTSPPEELGRSRDFSIDLILKLIMANDRMVTKLRCSGVTDHLKFQRIDGSFVYRNGKVYKVPVTESEVILTGLISLFQKRHLRRFLLDVEDADIDGGQVPKGLTPTTPMSEVYDKYSLDSDNRELIGHVIALNQNDEYLQRPCIETFKKINLYKESLQITRSSPYIYPEYGLGDLPQAFARISAVYGGTYMLSTDTSGIEYDSDGKVCGVRYGEKVVSTKCVIGDPSYFPDKVRKVRQVVRCICILNHPVEVIHPCQSGQIILPAGQTGRKSDIYVSVVSPNFHTSKQGYYIAIVATVCENPNPETDVKIGMNLLGRIYDHFISTYDVYEPVDDGTTTNVFISKSFDATTHFETAVADIDDLWKRITGEEFDEQKFKEKTHRDVATD
ncbi:Rab GDP dissociation inhibitor alpha [Thelohanellus kitauei]|uniref:Rab GDP dissociation inhibitor n=1 Tax=Thelohanellus kitauei TaxID=669202 RepID=A0A0C2JYF4_THEKT|nr:Rab GDP dissociation inhibitor alpha [Thelohanellus kitauei]